ncbi:MAG: N-acetylglucosamine-6-phosphate deacetylase [Bacillota bacterium]
MKVIKNINIVLPDQVIPHGSLAFEETIQKIWRYPIDFSGLDADIIDGEGGYLTPGFVNIHIHGAGGRDTMEATPEALDTISGTLIKNGVTSFLPTTMTMGLEDIFNALDNVRAYLDRNPVGARVLGVNVEGPFISEEKKGAQAPENIRQPEPDLFDNYLDLIQIMTVAAEKKGALKLIEKLSERGIVTSLGHSMASYEEVMEARRHGLSHMTHLYNAMTGLHHRRPGAVGAALTGDFTCELIADLIHIRPEVLKMTADIKNTDELVLITDAMEAAGLEEGTYSLGGQRVTVKEGSARLDDGTLAGSILTMDLAVENMLNATGLSLPEVINMATLNPARVLNLEHRLGQIKQGLLADLLLLEEDLQVKQVYREGQLVFEQ